MKRYNEKIITAITMLTPCVLAIVFIAQTFLQVCGYEALWLNIIGGSSFIILLHLLATSRLLGLCEHHRMFIYYLFGMNGVYTYDTYVGIPVETMTLLMIEYISFGCTVVLYGLLIYKHNKKQKKIFKDKLSRITNGINN